MTVSRFAISVWLSLLTVSVLAACGGGAQSTGPISQVPLANTSESFNLPVPSEIARGVSATDAVRDGAGFTTGNATVDGTDGVYSPDWPVSGPGNRQLAYAVYQFSVADPAGYTQLQLDWSSSPECYWLGLSNYVSNTWEWHECSGSLATPANLAPYTDSGDMLVAVAAIGETTGRLVTMTLEGTTSGHNLTDMFFLHHSTGTGIVNTGDVRGHVATYNITNGTSLEFWDHGYEGNGLLNADGVKVGTYGEYTNYTDPPDLHNLWTSDEAGWVDLRTTILANHEVISFKSCYPASNIPDESELEWRKTMYRNMRDFFDTRPDKLFIVMTMPPLNPAATNAGNASRARQFSNWLNSAEYLSGHPNVVCFDLFNVLAHPDDASAEANMLRADYRAGGDSHPTAPGYTAAGAALAEFFCDSAAAY